MVGVCPGNLRLDCQDSFTTLFESSGYRVLFLQFAISDDTKNISASLKLYYYVLKHNMSFLNTLITDLQLNCWLFASLFFLDSCF